MKIDLYTHIHTYKYIYIYLNLLWPRKYWRHWSSVASWMRDHPAKGSFPVSVYGDEAKYSAQYGDKFIALALGSPLLWKKGILTYTQDKCTKFGFDRFIDA